MKVLVVNKFWYVRGGLERVMFDEVSALGDAGHEVAHFSTRHPANDVSPWQDSFAPYIELGAGSEVSRSERMLAAVRLFHNGQANRSFEGVLREFRPDVVHCHGIHRQMSPSILDIARRHRVPVVQTLHDYHHVCPADVLLRAGAIPCDPRRCGTLDYSAAVRHRCVRGSLAASTLSALETGYQRLRRAYERSVSCFICPSRFMADSMERGGWRVPMRVVRNAVKPSSRARSAEDYFLFSGRLSSEKGLEVFLEAAERAGCRTVVAGEGPLGQALRSEYPSAEFVGRVAPSAVADLLAHARAAVVPSVWFENAPMSVLEPMASGVPVVATRIGGIPEMLDDDVEGLLVPAGDVDALATALVALAGDEARCGRMGQAGRLRVGRDFSPERHLQELLDTYEMVIQTGRNL